MIGDAIVARHLVCSRHWVVKTFAMLDRELLWETHAYPAANPHAGFLRAIARRAEIEWGRFDYSFLDGEPQIWEVNTNPIVIAPPWSRDAIDVDHLNVELHRVPMRRIATALLALDPDPVRIPAGADQPTAAPARSEQKAAAAPAPR